MNAAASLALPLLAVGVGAWSWGWRGALLGATVVVFALLLQFSRAVRTLQQAAARPKGRVANAVALHARLHAGQRLPQLLRIAGSLGVADDGAETGTAGEERYRWADGGGDAVHVRLRGGRVVDWQLVRAAPAES